MESLAIRSIGCYTRVERHCQVFRQTGFCLALSGMHFCRVTDPAGRLVWELAEDVPFLGFTLPGMRNDFEYGLGRRNWVAMFEGIPVRWGRCAGEAEVGCGDDWVAVPLRFRLAASRAESLDRCFGRMAKAFREPTPASRLAARVDLLAVLGVFLEAARGMPEETPAERLKAMIDADPGGRDTQENMAARCGYSVDHLRRLFQRRFGTTPREYRMQTRAAYAMDLLAHSELTVGEVAERTGYGHAAHFARAFRAVHGLSPREAIRRYRFGER